MHYKHLPSSVDYREDINGLRAWAVMAVVLFHFSLLGVSGGFVGVDVFFVISGYLMTAIVMKGLLQGNFSIKRFYLARARRILPALLVLVVVLLILGWFILPTPDYKTLGAQSVDAVSFMSNIYFWMRTGYFDSSAYEKWLLHTWSLSVEWQFYLIYPVLLVLAWKVKASLRSIGFVLCVLFLGSLIASIVTTQTNATAAFYGLHTRAWEMAAGGLVYLIAIQYVLDVRVRQMLLWTGWIGLITTFFVLSNTFKWPGSWAVLPVLSAVFILLANQTSSWLTENAVAQWLGDRSYSLYLWHWPLVVLLHFTGLNTDLVWLSMALILSLFLANFSYQWIEVPTRKILSKRSFKKEMWLILFATLFVAALAATVQNTVFSGRMDAAVERLASGEVDYQSKAVGVQCAGESDGKGHVVQDCFVHAGDKLGAILVGDSNAPTLVSQLGFVAGNVQKSIKLWSQAGCPALQNAYYADVASDKVFDSCAKFNEWFVKEAERFAGTPIVIANRLSMYMLGTNDANYEKEKGKPRLFFTKQYQAPAPEFLQEFEEHYVETLCQLAKTNPVYVMRPLPEMVVNVPQALSRNIVLASQDTKKDIDLLRSDYDIRHTVSFRAQDKAAEACGIKILDPTEYLCDADKCNGSVNLVPWYADSNHLNSVGADRLIPMFEKVFK
jgi:peptidoglycan/LPS O-acetylase OafA/YrhL